MSQGAGGDHASPSPGHPSFIKAALDCRPSTIQHGAACLLVLALVLAAVALRLHVDGASLHDDSCGSGLDDHDGSGHDDLHAWHRRSGETNGHALRESGRRSDEQGYDEKAIGSRHCASVCPSDAARVPTARVQVQGSPHTCCENPHAEDERQTFMPMNFSSVFLAPLPRENGVSPIHLTFIQGSDAVSSVLPLARALM